MKSEAESNVLSASLYFGPVAGVRLLRLDYLATPFDLSCLLEIRFHCRFCRWSGGNREKGSGWHHTGNNLSAMAAIDAEVGISGKDKGIGKRLGHTHKACIGEASAMARSGVDRLGLARPPCCRRSRTTSDLEHLRSRDSAIVRLSLFSETTGNDTALFGGRRLLAGARIPITWIDSTLSAHPQRLFRRGASFLNATARGSPIGRPPPTRQT